MSYNIINCHTFLITIKIESHPQVLNSFSTKVITAFTKQF